MTKSCNFITCVCVATNTCICCVTSCCTCRISYNCLIRVLACCKCTIAIVDGVRNISQEVCISTFSCIVCGVPVMECTANNLNNCGAISVVSIDAVKEVCIITCVRSNREFTISDNKFTLCYGNNRDSAVELATVNMKITCGRTVGCTKNECITFCVHRYIVKTYEATIYNTDCGVDTLSFNSNIIEKVCACTKHECFPKCNCFAFLKCFKSCIKTYIVNITNSCFNCRNYCCGLFSICTTNNCVSATYVFTNNVSNCDLAHGNCTNSNTC